LPSAFASGGKFFPLDPETGVFRLSNIPIADTYSAMEALLKTKKVKAIGVSNFNIRHLTELLSNCIVVPATNQIEKHPYLQQVELAEFCKSKNILLQAYSPLGNNQTGEPRTVDDVKVHEVAKKLGLDPGQVLVSWGVQTGHVVLPKSVTESRIKSNFEDVALPEWAMSEVNALERHKRFNFPAHWGFDIFDEAGTETVRKIAEEAGEENKTKFVV
jgi:diketogulonate reductase-like aldo/keto reductase